MKNQIVVLHEYGAQSHYVSLQYYCKVKNRKLAFYEFSISKQILKSIITINKTLLKKSINNFFFLIRLFFTKDETIVLGIAPYDYRLIFLNLCLRNHKVYYHTSWPFWDKKKYVKDKFLNIFPNVIFNEWQKFFKTKVRGVFSVTETAKLNLLKYYKIEAPIQVVYHSFRPEIFYPNATTINNKYLNVVFVGRLEEYKGILKIIEAFSNRMSKREITLNIIGEGKLNSLVHKLSKELPNVNYYGKLSAVEIGDMLRRSDILLNPSINNTKDKFEELFGISILEAMACGVVPISTNHVGPSEIIINNYNGIFIDQNNITRDIIDILTKIKIHELTSLKKNAILSSKKYKPENTYNKWNLLDDYS